MTVCYMNDWQTCFRTTFPICFFVFFPVSQMKLNVQSSRKGVDDITKYRCMHCYICLAYSASNRFLKPSLVKQLCIRTRVLKGNFTFLILFLLISLPFCFSPHGNNILPSMPMFFREFVVCVRVACEFILLVWYREPAYAWVFMLCAQSLPYLLLWPSPFLCYASFVCLALDQWGPVSDTVMETQLVFL